MNIKFSQYQIQIQVIWIFKKLICNSEFNSSFFIHWTDGAHFCSSLRSLHTLFAGAPERPGGSRGVRVCGGYAVGSACVCFRSSPSRPTARLWRGPHASNAGTLCGKWRWSVNRFLRTSKQHSARIIEIHKRTEYCTCTCTYRLCVGKLKFAQLSIFICAVWFVNTCTEYM